MGKLNKYSELIKYHEMHAIRKGNDILGAEASDADKLEKGKQEFAKTYGLKPEEFSFLAHEECRIYSLKEKNRLFLDTPPDLDHLAKAAEEYHKSTKNMTITERMLRLEDLTNESYQYLPNKRQLSARKSIFIEHALEYDSQEHIFLKEDRPLDKANTILPFKVSIAPIEPIKKEDSKKLNEEIPLDEKTENELLELRIGLLATLSDLAIIRKDCTDIGLDIKRLQPDFPVIVFSVNGFSSDDNITAKAGNIILADKDNFLKVLLKTIEKVAPPKGLFTIDIQNIIQNNEINKIKTLMEKGMTLEQLGSIAIIARDTDNKDVLNLVEPNIRLHEAIYFEKSQEIIQSYIPHSHLDAKIDGFTFLDRALDVENYKLADLLTKHSGSSRNQQL